MTEVEATSSIELAGAERGRNPKAGVLPDYLVSSSSESSPYHHPMMKQGRNQQVEEEGEDHHETVTAPTTMRRLDFTSIHQTVCARIRGTELQTLLDYATSSKTKPAIWIEAEAGVGKSTLLFQFQEQVRRLNNNNSDDMNMNLNHQDDDTTTDWSILTLCGKFEERAAASEPFAVLQQAVSQLVTYLLQQPLVYQQSWAKGFQQTQEDGSISLLLSILPILKVILSVKDDSEDEGHQQGGDEENKDEESSSLQDIFGDFKTKEYRFERFRLTFRALIRYTCAQLMLVRPQTTLVLMLDDFHWIDPDSLQIVKTLMEDNHKPTNFLLITATRPLDGYNHIYSLYRSMVTTSHASTGTTRLATGAGGSTSQLLTCSGTSTRGSSIFDTTNNSNAKVRIMGVPRLSVAEIVDILKALLGRTTTTTTTDQYDQKDDADLIDFAKIIKSKTHGNSFVVIQFLRLLERLGEIYWCHKNNASGGGCWRFNTQSIARVHFVSDNVSEVVAHSLQTEQNPRRRSALMVAASFGVSQFDVSTIVHAVQVVEQQEQRQQQQHQQQQQRKVMGGESLSSTTCSVTMRMNDDGDDYFDSSAMMEEYEDPYIVRRRVNDMSCELSEAAMEGLVEEMSPGHFRFAHDRIRESAYSLLPEGSSRMAVHLKVGRQLRSWMDTQSELGLSNGFSNESLLLHATKQLNAGADLIDDDWELLDLADLNYQSAELAARKTAFFSAIEYLQVGLSVMVRGAGQRLWETHYDRTLQFCLALTRMQYSCGLLEECWETSGFVIDNAKTFLDKSGMYHTRILCLMQQELMDEALELLLDVFDLMGSPLPRRFVMGHVIRETMKAQKFLKNTSDEELLNLPIKHDEDLEIQLDFLQTLAEVGFLSDNFGYVYLVTMRYINLVNEQGNYPRSFFSAQLYASFFKPVFGDFEGAMRYGNLANTLAERQELNLPGYVARSTKMFHSYVHHWQAPFRDSLSPNIDAFQRMWKYGMVDTVLFDALCLLQHFFVGGEPLERTIKECAKYAEAFKDYQQMYNWFLNASQHQAMLNLQGHNTNNNPAILTGEYMDAEACQEIWRRKPNKPALYNFQFWSMVLGFHFGDLQQAKQNIKAIRSDLMEDGSTVLVPLRLFYTGLVYLALFRETRKSKYRGRATKAWKQLQKWANSGAVNCVYMCDLLKAEDLASQRRSTVEDTMAAYGQAIKSVTELGLCHHMALAYELAGVYLLAHADEGKAVSHLSEAVKLYHAWGAMAKVKDLISRYPRCAAPSVG